MFDETEQKQKISEYKEEIAILRDLVHRLNVELSRYQAMHPSSTLKSTLSVRFLVRKFKISLHSNTPYLLIKINL